jgi:hypothetical protein
MTTHQRKLGDTLKPLNSILYYGDDPYDIAALTVKFQMEGEDNGTSKVAESTTGVTIHPTQVFTAEADDEYLTCNAHGVKEGNQIVVANSGGALPTGLTASTRYWPINITPNRFQLAAYPGGPAVALTTDGTGTNTFYVVGSVQKVFLAADVNAVGRYSAWWTVYSGSDRATAPTNGQITVEILPLGN